MTCLFSDIDECNDNPSVCSCLFCSHYNVTCLFSDINECADKSSVCSYLFVHIILKLVCFQT